MDVAAAAYIVMHYSIIKRKNTRERRWWQTQMYKSREIYGGNHLLLDLKFQSISGLYKNFTRISPSDFEFLITLVGPKICRKDTRWRKAISVQERLAVTMRFLATGDSFTSLQYLFKISKQSISAIIPEVCGAIVEGLKKHIQIPITSEKWLDVAKQYNDAWNFPHCLGALDGKHVVLQAPMNTGSEYFNYKSTFSIVLFALVDPNYNFLYVDAGGQGRISDGGIFKNCSLYNNLQNNYLSLPQAKPLDGRQREIPYFFVGDEAFALSDRVMKPFSGVHKKGSIERIFNYRLSRARRVVENVFGITSAIFRVLRKPMSLSPEKAALIVMTIAHLHNFIRKSSTSCQLYTPKGIFDTEKEGKVEEGSYRTITNDPMSSLLPLRNIPRKSPTDAKAIRDELANFFQEEGRISWQDNYV